MLAKISLRPLLIIPFVLQVVSAVGLIGWLSFRSGQRSTNHLASQLREKVAHDVEHHIFNILTMATTASQLTTQTIQSEQLNLQDVRVLEDLYWNHLITFESIRGLGAGNTNGQILGMFRQVENGETSYHIEYTAAGNNYVSSKLDADRQVIDTSIQARQVDARGRPWYQTALNAGKSVWTQPYISIGKSTSQALLLNYSTPIFDDDRTLQGVVSVILDLSEINQLLSELDLGPSGHVFIMQTTGELIGTSDGQSPVFLQNDIAQQLKATDSTTPLIQSAAQYLNQRLDHNLNLIQQPQQLEFTVEGQRQLLQVVPMSASSSVNWLRPRAN